jgi:protoheme ferro-lyase
MIQSFFSQRTYLKRLGGGLSILAAIGACGSLGSKLLDEPRAGEKVGLLFASHGDIDDADRELESYIKVSFQKNVGIPLPNWSRNILTNPAYALSVRTVRAQYDVIGATKYRANSQAQADLITEKLQATLPGAKAYLGYNFTSPFIEETLDVMKRDGITKIVVMNKGAQFSYASSGENHEDALKYFDKNPDYDAEALGVLSYSDDPRFIDVLAKALDADAKRLFPGVPASDVCLLVGSHGLPQWLINRGDSAITQMQRNVIDLRRALPQYKVYHGFLNDDFFPGAQWVAPKAIDLAPKLVSDLCKNVLMDGRLSFTTHHRATLYDLNVEVKNLIEREVPSARVVLAPNFDTDPLFAQLVADLTKETLELKGKSVWLKRKGERSLRPGSVGIPGTVLDTVTHQQPVLNWSPSPL